MNNFSFQVELKEYVKLKDSIYEVDSKEEQCLRFSRLLNYKVRFSIFGLCWPSCETSLLSAPKAVITSVNCSQLTLCCLPEKQFNI